jgi:hypothetical protein
LRSGTGSSPIPTLTRLVAASIAVAVAMPLSEKQSSQTHISASPAASAAAATATIRSGGCEGGKMAASVTTGPPWRESNMIAKALLLHRVVNPS